MKLQSRNNLPCVGIVMTTVSGAERWIVSESATVTEAAVTVRRTRSHPIETKTETDAAKRNPGIMMTGACVADHAQLDGC